MKNYYILCLVLLFGAILTACKKDQEAEPQPSLAGEWKLTASTRVDEQGTVSDRLSVDISSGAISALLEKQQADCYVGSRLLLLPDSTFATVAGSACTRNNTSFFTQSGTYRVLADGKSIVFTGKTTFSVKTFPDATIQELTFEKLQLRYPFVSPVDKKKYTVTDTFLR
ncbi:hypothetical protein [Arundinibacter roseus]|uniref:Lipocalin-like domain-containing protein n=1 Tax=Arundinibacter roseus TaxID=2070510 RepID=A0A4R4K1T1_9BACT|nr:hypothetical protein [Arundinibacter roseus]TDB60376.1 hypothetical protein EZE20_20805 [Arundinibacter roseus]